MRFEHVQRVCECIVRGEKKKGIFSNERFSSEDCRKPDTAGVIAPEEEERKKRGGGGGKVIITVRIESCLPAVIIVV